MEAYICSCCGMNLKVEGDLLRCDYCGAAYGRDDGEEAAAKLKGVLDEAKLELLANRKRVLWSAAHERYPSGDKVVGAARDVLSVDGSDLLALVYLHSHDRDPMKLNQILASAEAAESQAAEVFRWLLPSLSPRMVGPLHDFVDRHFSNERRIGLITELEKEAARVSEGIYEAGLPREAFLCYSSADMPKVVETMDSLERNGFSCFAAFRNLRHGKGAQEDYLSSIKAAMRACDAIVFFSSGNSRSMDCDAMRVELPYLIQELPDKPRIEYLLEDYGDVPYMVRKTLKKAFPSQEFCVDEEDLMDRIQIAVEGKGPKNEGEAERLRRELEAERERHQKELEEAKRAFGLAKQSQAREEPKSRQESPETPPPSAVPKAEGRFVYYGEYPQSQVKDASLLDRLESATPKDGIISLDGKRYAAHEGKYFLFEPIKWKVLKRKGDEVLIISNSVLDARRFAARFNNYANSEIREWLNNDFYKTAFTLGDDRILTTEVDNSDATTDSPKNNEYACEDTRDKAFLLSYRDYENADYGFTDKASRRCAPTDYAVARGALKYSENGYGYYWTRSPSSNDSNVAECVYSDGDLYGSYVYGSGNGVRPSLRIKLAE